MDKNNVLKKIMSYYNFKWDYMFAQFIGISPQTLSNWISRGTYNAEILSTKCVEFNPDWILNGNQPVFKKEYEEFNIPNPFSNEPENNSTYKRTQNIPLYKLDSTTSLKDIINKKSETVVITDFLRIPDLAECDGAVYVKGNSMQPLLKSGDIVIFKSISVKNIFWGELYLIETLLDDGSPFLTIRYLQKSESGDNFVKLISENPAHENQNLKLEKINILALIRSSIRYY